MYNMAAFEPICAKAEGSITLRGEVIHYRTVCEDNVFYDEAGTPIASIFSYSYLRTGVESENRPVLFCFNGGPGASSMYVHAGCFGAKRVQYPEATQGYPSLPPYRVIDNPDCLLDVADLVMVDPVGTGLGLLLNEAEASRFLGIEEDAEALVMFIARWLTRYRRWNSPKYLVGESYGCTRAATAASIAFDGGKTQGYSIAFDGLVLIGNTVTVAKYFNRGAPIEPAVEAFPTMAALNWYHKRPTAQPLEGFVAQACAFAATEYLTALNKGESLTGSERDAVKKKVMYYTGVSSAYLEARDLRLERLSFCQELLRDRGEVLSILDGRFCRPVHQPTALEGQPGYSCDAASQRFNSFYRAALCGEIFQSLGLADIDRNFVPSCSYGTELVPGSRWNFETEQLISGDRLSSVMAHVPGMRTMFANGWYDLCTQTGIVYHTMTHRHLPPERTVFRAYCSGHMAYVGEENVKQLSEDIRVFISGKSFG